MRQDEFTKALKSILQAYGREYTAIVDKLTNSIFRHMNNGDSITQAYIKARKEINFYKLNAEAIEDAVYESMLKGYGIKAKPLLVGVEGESTLRHKLMDVPWTADKMKLSTRLHGVDRALRSNVVATVSKSLRTYKTIHQTAMALYDGYSVPNKVLNQAELPKYLNEIKNLTKKMYSGDIRAARESKIYKAVTHDIRKLKTPALRAAYQQAVDASATDKKSALNKARKMLKMGSDKQEVMDMLLAEREKAMKKALDVATHEKTRYYAERIARTESARSYYEGQLEKAKTDDDIFGFKWVLSSAHHDETDCECEDNANADLGFGKGIYPKDDLPELPAHPNCMCHFKTVYTWEVKSDYVPNENEIETRIKE